MTCTFLDNITLSPIYATSSGYTEREIPKSSYLSRIEDVTIESVHLCNHEHYHKEVYCPMMNKFCSDFHGYDEEEHDEMPDELTSVGWIDVDIQHLNSVKRTGVEQMCDVCIIFKELKFLGKLLTLNDVMNDSSLPELDKLFKRVYDEDEINIFHAKIRILKDFLK
eukprot:1235834-Ditylum_brightwellii.AAC.1